MRRAKRLELRKLRAEQAACASKFDALGAAMQEYGVGTVRKMRDNLNPAGVFWEKSRPEFSTHVKGSNKKPNSGSQPPKGW